VPVTQCADVSSRSRPAFKTLAVQLWPVANPFSNNGPTVGSATDVTACNPASAASPVGVRSSPAAIIDPMAVMTVEPRARTTGLRTDNSCSLPSEPEHFLRSGTARAPQRPESLAQ